MKLNKIIYIFLCIFTGQTAFAQTKLSIGIEVSGAYNNAKIIDNENLALTKPNFNKFISTSLAFNFTVERRRNFLEFNVGTLQSYWASKVDFSRVFDIRIFI